MSWRAKLAVIVVSDFFYLQYHFKLLVEFSPLEATVFPSRWIMGQTLFVKKTAKSLLSVGVISWSACILQKLL